MGTNSKQIHPLARVLLSLLTVLTIFGVSIFGMSSVAFAGRDGGGGTGELHFPQHGGYDDPGAYVTLLEFWEAREGLEPFKQKLTIPRSKLPVLAQVKNAINKMRAVNPDFAAAIWQSYQHIFANPQHNIMRNLPIRPEVDTDQPYDCNDCMRVGIGEYDDANDVLNIAKKWYNDMDNTNKAGFRLHEAIYRILRLGSGETNSVETQLIVGLLFSTKSLAPVITHRLTKSFICVQHPDPKYPNEPMDRFKFLLHTDGNETIMVPVSHVRAGLPIDEGGEYFWKPQEYLVDWHDLPYPMPKNLYVVNQKGIDSGKGNFGGKLSDFLFDVGESSKISKLSLNNGGYGSEFPFHLPIPIRSKYYGIYLDVEFQEASASDKTGVIEFFRPDIYQGYNEALGGEPRNLRGKGALYGFPEDAYTATCREF